MLTFFVAGNPQSQGGMRDVTAKNGHHALITTGSKDLKPWRRAVSDVATLAVNAAQWRTLEACSVAVTLRFFLPMPKSRPAMMHAGGIRLMPIGLDLDKMVRAMLDSLTKAEVYKDDRQVAELRAVKYEISPPELNGVEVIVHPLEDDWGSDSPMLRALARRQEMAGAHHRLRRLAVLPQPR
jgi:Holliday junction resolvase RusA-like endonuclease